MKKEFREVKSSETYKGFHLKEGFYINEKLDRIITGFDLFNDRDLSLTVKVSGKDIHSTFTTTKPKKFLING